MARILETLSEIGFYKKENTAMPVQLADVVPLIHSKPTIAQGLEAYHVALIERLNTIDSRKGVADMVTEITAHHDDVLSALVANTPGYAGVNLGAGETPKLPTDEIKPPLAKSAAPIGTEAEGRRLAQLLDPPQELEDAHKPAEDQALDTSGKQPEDAPDPRAPNGPISPDAPGAPAP